MSRATGLKLLSEKRSAWLRERTEEIGGHLFWNLACSAKKAGCQPVVNVIKDGKRSVMLTRRFLWDEMGRPFKPGKMIVATCGESLCVAPAHLAQMDYRERAEMLKSYGKCLCNTPNHQLARLRASVDTITRDPEMQRRAVAMRADGMQLWKIGKELGVTRQTAKKLLNAAGQASVFNPSVVLRASPARNADSVLDAA